MNKILKRFRQDEDGAVTVDWVVLTAAIVTLGMAAQTTIGNGTKDVADTIGGEMAATQIATY